ncbi:MAG TPA: ABC transporter permease [Terrimicrobiaceae bacterium]|nr:ABC transporter permease [Terrimicrobiaceae bacterium]
MSTKSTPSNKPAVCLVRSSRTDVIGLAETMRRMFSDLRASLHTGLQLATRDIHGLYRQNILGFAWILLPPIVTTALWLGLSQAGIAVVRTDSGMPYPVFLTLGTLLWSLFTDALNTPRLQVAGNMGTLANISFPPESVIVSGIMQIILNFTVRLLLLIGVAAWFEYLPSLWSPALALAALYILLLGTALGVFLIPFTTIYKDIGQMLNLGIPLLMYTAPVVYGVPQQGLLRYLMLANPLTYAFNAARSCIDGVFVSTDLIALAALTPLAIAALLAAWAIFRITLPHLVERG